MWFSYGTNINSTAANTNTTTSSSPIVGISRFDDKSNTYLPVNNNDVLINKINATGTKSVEKVPEYYEKIVMGMENVKNKAGLNKHSAEHKRKVTDFVESIANGQPISNKKAKIVKASNNVAADSKPQETKAKLKEEVKAADV